MNRVLLWVKIALIAVCVAAGLGVPAAAQPADTMSAVVVLAGKLFTWTPGATALQPLNACDLEGYRALRAALSPRGTHLALNVVDDETFFGGYAPTPTGSVWICDLVQGVSAALTTQGITNTSTSLVAVWSPDGAAVAWAEVNTDESATIFAYDVQTQTISTLVGMTPLDYGCGVGPLPPAMAWTEAGIVVGYFIRDPEDICLSSERGFYIYDRSGTLSAAIRISGFEYGVPQWVWDSASGDRIFLWNEREGTWSAIDASDGTQAAVAGVAEAYVLESGGPSVGALGAFDVRLPGIDSVLRNENADVSAALSPDGRAALVRVESTLFGVADGEITVLPIPEIDRTSGGSSFYYLGTEVVWAPPRYRLGERPASSPCPAVEALYLADELGEVIAGMGANNLRAVPLRSGENVGYLAEGERFAADSLATVCSDGIRWREVYLPGGTAWTAESQESTYFVSPTGPSR